MLVCSPVKNKSEAEIFEPHERDAWFGSFTDAMYVKEIRLHNNLSMFTVWRQLWISRSLIFWWLFNRTSRTHQPWYHGINAFRVAHWRVVYQGPDLPKNEILSDLVLKVPRSNVSYSTLRRLHTKIRNRIIGLWLFSVHKSAISHAAVVGENTEHEKRVKKSADKRTTRRIDAWWIRDQNRQHFI